VHGRPQNRWITRSPCTPQRVASHSLSDVPGAVRRGGHSQRSDTEGRCSGAPPVARAVRSATGARMGHSRASGIGRIARTARSPRRLFSSGTGGPGRNCPCKAASLPVARLRSAPPSLRARSRPPLRAVLVQAWGFLSARHALRSLRCGSQRSTGSLALPLRKPLRRPVPPASTETANPRGLPIEGMFACKTAWTQSHEVAPSP